MTDITDDLNYLKLIHIRDHYESLGRQAADEKWTFPRYLSELIRTEAALRRDRAADRRVRSARFPQIKTLDQFKWTFPKQINRLQVQTLFRLRFIKNKGNVIFLGGVGLGKTHLAAALGYHACLKGYSVLFTTAIDAVNNLTTARKTGGLKQALKKYCKPSLLVLDELGHLPIDKTGADLLFQIISGRYEQGSLIITANRAFKDWPEIFNNDSALTSALLDRLLHHTETAVIEGSSYRMKDVIED